MTLTRRALNRATLDRQLLLRRASLSVPQALEHLGGLQAQTPQTWYVGLWTRLTGYDPAETAAMLGDGRIVRMALQRSTIHLASAADCRWMRPLLAVVGERGMRSAFGRHLVGIDREALVAAARTAFAGGPLTFDELGKALAPAFPDRDSAALAQAVRAWLPLAQVPPRGLWGRSGKAAHVPLDQWIGPAARQPGISPGTAGVERLVLRYLEAFGPATVRDAQQWSGLTRLGEVMERLRPRLVSFRDEQARELFDLPEAPRPDPDASAPVRFLYDFDNLLLSHADRTRVVDVDYTRHGFGGHTMEVPRSMLADGFVAATWKVATGHERATLTVRPFRRLTATERDQTEKEGAALLGFLATGRTHDIVVGKP
jgi:hypothetical protein